MPIGTARSDFVPRRRRISRPPSRSAASSTSSTTTDSNCFSLAETTDSDRGIVTGTRSTPSAAHDARTTRSSAAPPAPNRKSVRRSTSRIRPICATDQSRNSGSCPPSTSARANSERNRSRMTPGSVTPRSSRATGNSVYPPGMNFGFSDPDLFLPERLADLDALFRERLGREDPDLALRHRAMRAEGADEEDVPLVDPGLGQLRHQPRRYGVGGRRAGEVVEADGDRLFSPGEFTQRLGADGMAALIGDLLGRERRQIVPGHLHHVDIPVCREIQPFFDPRRTPRAGEFVGRDGNGFRLAFELRNAVDLQRRGRHGGADERNGSDFAAPFQELPAGGPFVCHNQLLSRSLYLLSRISPGPTACGTDGRGIDWLPHRRGSSLSRRPMSVCGRSSRRRCRCRRWWWRARPLRYWRRALCGCARYPRSIWCGAAWARPRSCASSRRGQPGRHAQGR